MDIERVMMIPHQRHIRTDCRLLAHIDCVGDHQLQLRQSPGAGRRKPARKPQRRPILGAMDQMTDFVLEC